MKAMGVDAKDQIFIEKFDLNRSSEELFDCLSKVISCFDGGTAMHTDRMATLAAIIAEGMRGPPDFIRMIQLAAPLHDIGKIGIPRALLDKPGKLSPDEWKLMRNHVVLGVTILEGLTGPVARTALRIVAGHHERWDGSGYPEGVNGEAIPLEARIVAVADVFDALCSERSYKKAWSAEAARQEIIAGSGSHFDPASVAAFQQNWPEIQLLYPTVNA